MKADVSIRQDSEKNSGFRIALLASLVLHLCVLGFVYRFPFATDTFSEQINDPVSIEVILSGFNPQLSETIPINTDSALLSDNLEQSPGSVSNNQGLQEEFRSLDQNAEKASTALMTEGDEVQSPTTEPRTDPLQNPEKESNAIDGLQNSVATFLQDYRQDINQNWLEECTRYKKQYAAKDCPYADDYVTTLNPVSFKTLTETQPLALAPGEFSAQESFRLMTQTDLFNPYMLSGNIPIFGLGGGGVLNVGIDLVKNSFALTQAHETLLFSNEETASVTVEAEADEDDGVRPGFFIRPPLF